MIVMKLGELGFMWFDMNNPIKLTEKQSRKLELTDKSNKFALRLDLKGGCAGMNTVNTLIK